ncbi:MAG: patatin-like phospholipase family protein [Rhizobiaceae bacterium]
MTNLGMKLCTLLLASLLVGCVTRPAESPQFRDATPQDAVHLNSLNSEQTSSGDDGILNILALSSGGAYGAYGVGILNGWSERGTRPEFDIVTGVSTGALMSVFAFLGPQYDGILRHLYTDVKADDIFISRGIKGLFSDSLYDNTPLKKQIEKYVTANLLRQIATEHAKGRRLYIATTNLDAGASVIWDMGKIASGGRASPVQHFQKILRASSAVPGFFPPVYIKPQRGVQLRQAHVDGGVKSPLLVSDFLFRSKAKKRRLFIIANDSIAQRDAYAAVDGNLPSIARKTILTLTKELLIQNVYRGYVRAKNSGTQFNLTSVPDKLGLNTKSLSFDRKTLDGLYQAGRNRALSDTPWLHKPVGIGRYDVARH